MLMDLPMVRHTETGHILIVDEYGVGTPCVFQNILGQIRSQKAIIVDSNGTLLDKYYDPACDIVMNPFDQRFPGWDMGGECSRDPDYDAFAKQLILPTKDEPFLTESSRLLFSGILQHLHKQQQCSVENVLKYVSTVDLKTLHAELAHTEVAGFINPKAAKTATRLRNHTAVHIECLEPLVQATHDNPFSMRRWMEDPDQKGFVFLSATPAQWPRLKLLFSCWFSIAMKSRREYTPSSRHLTWFVIDDLFCLDKLPDLLPFLADSAKHDACMVMGIQDMSWLESAYNNHIVQNLIDACSTQLFFRCSPVMARKLSGIIGTQGQQSVPGISSDKLANLPDSVSLVRLPQGYPVMTVHWSGPV